MKIKFFIFTERKTSPHWGLMRLEVPVAEFPSVPDSTGLPLDPGACMAQELMVSLAKYQDFPVISENVSFLLRWKITGIGLQL